jgi:hypothetical protein
VSVREFAKRMAAHQVRSLKVRVVVM